MYKSSIEKIYGELQTQMVQEDENMVMKAIRKVGVNVDKEELIKALNYDRNQYSKGYNDGKNDVLDKIRVEIEQLKLHKAQFLTSDNKVCIDSQEVLNIIDKYKAESEDKENERQKSS